MKAEEMTREALADFVGKRECEEECEGTCDDCPFALPNVNEAMKAWHEKAISDHDGLLDLLAALTGAMAAISGILRACRELANRPQEEDADAEEI